MLANLLTCPSCGTILKLANPLPAGKKIKCSQCATVFAVPAASAPGVAPKPFQAPSQPVPRAEKMRKSAARTKTMPPPEEELPKGDEDRTPTRGPQEKGNKKTSPALFWGLVGIAIVAVVIVGGVIAIGAMAVLSLLHNKPEIAQSPAPVSGPVAEITHAPPAGNSTGDQPDKPKPPPAPADGPKTQPEAKTEVVPPAAQDQPKSQPEPTPQAKAEAPSTPEADPPVANGDTLPRKAEVGKLFTYHLWPGKGKLYPYLKAAGPAGLEISPEGVIRWTPEKGTAGTQDLTVLIASGQTQINRYKIEVEDHSAKVAVADAPKPQPAPSAEPNPNPAAPPPAQADPLVANGDELPRKAEVGKPFSYQLSTSTGKGTYNQITGPKGLTVSREGLVSWTPDKGMAGTSEFLVQINGNEVARYKIVIDEPSESGIALFPLPAPGGWVMTSDNITLIVSVPEKAQLVYFDTVANKEMKRVDVDFQPGALALQGTTLFAAARGASLVYALELESGKVKKEFNLAGDAVANLACHPSKGLLYASTTKFAVCSIDGQSGDVTKTKASGFFLAVDPVEGEFVYTGVQPPDRDEVVFKEGKDGTFQIYFDQWGRRAMVMKYAVDGKDLKFVSGQNNAAVNGWAMHLTPDGKRIMMVGGGGWRPKDEGANGGYVVAVYNTSNLEAMVGQAPHGLNIAFHPVLNLGVTNIYGTELVLFNAKSLVKKGTIPVAKNQERRPSLLTFGGRGSKVILWNGEDVKNRQGLHFIPLELTKDDLAALDKAYGKP